MWGYNLLNFSRGLTRPLHFYGWDLLAVCHHPDRFCDYWHCDCGDIFLNCQTISCDNMFQGLSEFMGGIPTL